MRRIIHTLQSSAIVRKMTLRLLLIEVIILVLLVVLSQAILLPRLKNSALRSSEQSMAALGTQLESQINHYISYSQSIIHIDTICNDITEYQQNPNSQNYNLLSLRLTEQCNNSDSIRGIQLESADGAIFRSVINLRDTDLAQLHAAWYQAILYGESTRFFGAIYDPGLSTPSDSLAYARRYYIGDDRYVLTIFFNCSDLTAIAETALTAFDGLLITDYMNSSVYEVGNIQESHSVYSSNPGLSLVETADGYYFFDVITSSSWNIVGYISNATLMQEYWNIFTACVTICTALCILTVMVAIPTMGHIVAPIHQLSLTMQQAAQGDTSVKAIVSGNDEIAELSSIFNEMLHNLNEHTAQKIAFETNEQKMRYNLLLAQIDSHFIGNTMSTINSLARQGKTSDVIALNTALLKIIQNNLRVRDLDITDTIAQEIEMVEQYWIISKIRQENHVVLSWDVADDILEENIPKNIIQPLVENSLFHGLTDELTGEMHGKINISIHGDAEQICIQVSDNGKGIQPLMLQYLNDPLNTMEYLRERGRHIGIANIRQRLEHFYKKNCLLISCKNGTTVTISIPRTNNMYGGIDHAENL